MQFLCGNSLVYCFHPQILIDVDLFVSLNRARLKICHAVSYEVILLTSRVTKTTSRSAQLQNALTQLKRRSKTTAVELRHLQ